MFSRLQTRERDGGKIYGGRFFLFFLSIEAILRVESNFAVFKNRCLWSEEIPHFIVWATVEEATAQHF